MANEARSGACPPTAPYQIINTVPLPEDQIVTSRRFETERQVASAPNADVVRTITEDGRFQTISDEQLLALVSPRPAVLVRVGPGMQQLVLANPEDREGLPVN